MDQNSLDNIFKESLYTHETAIDNAALWSAIVVKKKKDKFLYFFLLGSSALVLAASSLYFGSSLFSANSTNTTSSQIENKKPELNTSATATISNEIKKDASVQSTNQEIKETKPNNIEEKTAEKFETTKNQNFNNKSKIALTEVASGLSLGASSIGSTKIPRLTSNANLQQSNSASIAENTSVNTFRKSTIVSLTNTQQKASQIQSKQLENSTHSALNHKPILAGTNLLDLLAPQPLKRSRKNKKIECYNHGPVHDAFAIEIYSSIDFVKNHLSANNNEYQNYLTERKATQAQLEGYRGGVRLKYNFRNGLYAKLGVEAGWIKERFNYTNDQRVFEEQVQATITTTSTGIDTTYETVLTPTGEKLVWDLANDYKTLGIPALLGYQLNSGKFTYGADLGAIYNLNYDFKGWFLDENLEPVDASHGYIKNKNGYSLTGGAHIGYDLSKKLNTYFSVSFRRDMSDINTTKNLIDQRHTNVGIGFGLSIKL